VLSEQKQRHTQIKYALNMRGSSLAQVANFLGLSQSTVTQVSQGRGRSRRVESALASALGTTPEQLFPDRYNNKEGEP